MRNKFIRILSPITIAVVFILDAAVIGFAAFAIRMIIIMGGVRTFIFAAIELIAIIIGTLVTKEIFSNGILFSETEAEFKGIDDDNVFVFAEIEKIEIFKDTSASLTKNFNDRHALLIFTMKDGKISTIDIGLVSVKTVNIIKEEFENHIDKSKIELNLIRKAQSGLNKNKNSENNE
ncbi:MAG: hypothetical protein LUG21_08245 [Clostridiales bacterium]|nr:hypothetical protein [Clostridiales bacterium]